MGEKALKRVVRVIDDHYGGGWTREFRAAPSLICRSELELLGLAAPRFAFRTRIRSQNGEGFLNCRRLQLLSEELQKAIIEHWNPLTTTLEPLQHDEIERARKELKERIGRSSPFAESVLPLPDRYSEFHAVSRDFGPLFGEPVAMLGTPFVNAIELGGGLCSQGACVMATLLRLDDAEFVRGPSEITALLKPPDREPAFRIRGLRIEDFVRYFRHPKVGLNCYHETAFLDGPGWMNLVAALRSYVLSDIPVIVLVDPKVYFPRMHSGRVKLDPNSKFHCILLIGTRRQWTGQYLAHDPSLDPWVELTAADLAACSPGGGRIVQFFPVLPRQVTRHLAQAREETNVDGLIRLAHLLQADRETLGRKQFGSIVDALPPCPANRGSPEFRLIDLRCFRDGAAAPLKHGISMAATEFLHGFAGQYAELRWIWLQELSDTQAGSPRWLWIWSATAADNRAEKDVRQILLAVAERQGGDSDTAWALAWRGDLEWAAAPSAAESLHRASPLPAAAGQQPSGVVNPDPRPPIQPSLITSFLPTKTTYAASFWPPKDCGAISCELYGFMLLDCNFLDRQSRVAAGELFAPGGQIGLHAKLCAIGQSEQDVATLARVISSSSFPPEERPIIGIASYIPEVCKPPSSQGARLAIGSLTCLARLAIALKRLGHPVGAVECVGGSRVVGINWKQLIADLDGGLPPDLSVVIESPVRALEWLVAGMAAAFGPCEKELVEHGIAISAELEPGEFFVLKSLTEIHKAIELAQAHGLQRLLAANLDVGHYAMDRHLADDKVDWDWRLANLEEHLAHCHLSQHSRKGHFADGQVSDATFDHVVQAILASYFRGIQRRREKELPVTACVSLEMEAAPNPDAVYASLAALRRWLQAT